MVKELRMYVQLGKRYKNGRIAKAENYELDGFFDLCIAQNKGELQVLKMPNKLDRFFRTKRYRRFKTALRYFEAREAFRTLFTKGMKKLIEADEYGRKQK